MSDWQCTEMTVPKHLAFSRKQLVERIEALESKLDKRNRALFDNIKELVQLKAKLDAVINAVYDGCDCDCRGNVNKALQEQGDD